MLTSNKTSVSFHSFFSLFFVFSDTLILTRISNGVGIIDFHLILRVITYFSVIVMS